jgi:hypothetical protein
VTDGLLRSGLYKVLVVAEFDPVTADIHRGRFPSVPVLVYELGNSIDGAIGEILRFAPRSIRLALPLRSGLSPLS